MAGSGYGQNLSLDLTGIMESKIHKALKFPYMISVPDINESQWTTWLIKTPEDEAELDKYFPEFFEDKPMQAEQASRLPMYKLECLECGYASETDRKDTRMVCRRCKHRPLMVVTNLIK